MPLRLVWHARQHELDKAAWRLGQHGIYRRPFRKSHVATVPEDRVDNRVGDDVSRHVDQYLELVEALERCLRRRIRVDIGQHFGRDRTQLHERHANGSSLQIGAKPGRELVEPTRSGDPAG